MKGVGELSVSAIERGAEEDFELTDFLAVEKSFSIFHLMIRKKYLKKMSPSENFCEENRADGFEVEEDVEDHFAFYKRNYRSLKVCVSFIDGELFKRLFFSRREKLLERFRSLPASQTNFSTELEAIVLEFLFQLEQLEDIHKKLRLYKLIDQDNFKTFSKVEIDTKMRNFLVPFIIGKLFGKVNDVSSKTIQKICLTTIKKLVKFNVGYLELFIPSFEVIDKDGKAGRMLDSFLTSKIFKKQHEKLKFLMNFLNEKVADQLKDIERSISGFFSKEQPLSFEDFKTCHEVLNLRLEESNLMKLDAQDELLDFDKLCKLGGIDLKKEVQNDLQAQLDQLDRLADSFDGIEPLETDPAEVYDELSSLEEQEPFTRIAQNFKVDDIKILEDKSDDLTDSIDKEIFENIKEINFDDVDREIEDDSNDGAADDIAEAVFCDWNEDGLNKKNEEAALNLDEYPFDEEKDVPGSGKMIQKNFNFNFDDNDNDNDNDELKNEELSDDDSESLAESEEEDSQSLQNQIKSSDLSPAANDNNEAEAKPENQVADSKGLVFVSPTDAKKVIKPAEYEIHDMVMD